MQGTRVPSLVQEQPTCCWTTKSACHKYWARLCPGLQQQQPPRGEARGLLLENSLWLLQLKKARAQQRRPSAAKHKYIKKKSYLIDLGSWLSIRIFKSLTGVSKAKWEEQGWYCSVLNKLFCLFVFGGNQSSGSVWDQHKNQLKYVSQEREQRA